MASNIFKTLYVLTNTHYTVHETTKDVHDILEIVSLWLSDKTQRGSGKARRWVQTRIFIMWRSEEEDCVWAGEGGSCGKTTVAYGVWIKGGNSGGGSVTLVV